jgi:hypothetical protein
MTLRSEIVATRQTVILVWEKVQETEALIGALEAAEQARHGAIMAELATQRQLLLTMQAQITQIQVEVQ